MLDEDGDVPESRCNTRVVELEPVTSKEDTAAAPWLDYQTLYVHRQSEG